MVVLGEGSGTQESECVVGVTAKSLSDHATGLVCDRTVVYTREQREIQWSSEARERGCCVHPVDGSNTASVPRMSISMRNGAAATACTTSGTSVVVMSCTGPFPRE